MKGTSAVAVALVMLGLALCAEAYVVKAHRKSSEEFALTGRFCFNTGTKEEQDKHGIYLTETATKFTNGGTFWALYYDVKGSWYANYNNKTRTCAEKLQSASWSRAVSGNMTHTVHPHNYARPYIWYMVLLNCPLANHTVANEYDIDYKITFINADGTHVGNDEKGMLPLNAIYFVFFFIVFVVHCLGAYFLWLKRSLHPIVQILAICLALSTFATMFVLIHWAGYGKNGIGCPGCRVFGQLLNGISSVFFATLLCMIASGWAITFHALPRKPAIIGLFASYLTFYVVVFIIAAATGSSTASTQLVYSTGAVLGIVIIYILADRKSVV